MTTGVVVVVLCSTPFGDIDGITSKLLSPNDAWTYGLLNQARGQGIFKRLLIELDRKHTFSISKATFSRSCMPPVVKWQQLYCLRDLQPNLLRSW